MTPHLTDKALDKDGRTVETIAPTVFSHVMSPQTATAVGAMMSHVVNDGAPGRPPRCPASRSPARPGRPSSAPGRRSNQVWFIAFAPLEQPADRDRRDGRAGEPASAARSPRRSPRRCSSRCSAAGRVRGDARACCRDADRRPLPRGLADRLGRDGGRLLRRGPPARPPGRRQAAAPALRRGRGVRRALPPRGVERGLALAPQRRRRLRPRRVGRAPTTSRWSTSTGARSRRSVREEGPLAPLRAIEIITAGARRARASPTSAGSSTATSSRTT